MTPQSHLFRFFPVLPQCDLCKVIILTEDGLDLRSEIFLLRTLLFELNVTLGEQCLVAQMKWAEPRGTLNPVEEIDQQSQLGISYEKSETIYQADWELIIY